MTEGPQAVRYGSAPLVFGDDERNSWIRRSLEELPAGSQILDVGAGPMRYRDLCRHLSYVSHDFCQYDGRGDGVGYQNQDWDTSRIDIVSDISTIPVATRLLMQSFAFRCWNMFPIRFLQSGRWRASSDREGRSS